MFIKTAGLILRRSLYKESSLVLTVLTSSQGKLTVLARGARRKGSKLAAATQTLALAELTLFSQKGRFTLTEARTLTLFEGLREDIERFALGSYFAELLEAVADEDLPDPALLSLGLNALYALSEGNRDPELVKAAFELRLCCQAGFEPAVGACQVCGRQAMADPLFDLQGGTVACRGCGGQGVTLPQGALAAMRHIVSCDPKKLYSFALSGPARQRLCSLCEGYTLTHLGESFRTLDYYKSLKVSL